MWCSNFSNKPKPMSEDDASFFTMRWTRVAHSQGDSESVKLGLSELCEAYYAPVHAFVRATLRDDEAARDLTQAFFTKVLGQDAFEGADPERGRFRSFLLGAVKHFLWDSRRRDYAQKRGGGVPDLSLDETAFPEDTRQLPPDAEFDRRWALTILTKALAGVRKKMEEKRQLEMFEALKPWLT
jgi:DNA-directed RNA polymerase specialized sigma24 family protein